MPGVRLYLPLLPIAIWLGFRATAPSRLAAEETAVGMVLLLGAIAVMATAARGHGKPYPLPVVVASAFILSSLVASGDLAVSLDPISHPTGIYANGLSLLSPALNGVIGHRLFFYLPLVSVVAITVIGYLLGVAVSLMNAARSHPRRAGLGLAGLLPATLAAPAACGPSLLAGLGAGTAGLLGAVAPPLLAPVRASPGRPDLAPAAGPQGLTGFRSSAGARVPAPRVWKNYRISAVMHSWLRHATGSLPPPPCSCRRSASFGFSFRHRWTKSSASRS